MAIATSTVIADSAQLDGRRHIIERHVDDQGTEHLVFYMAESGADVNAVLSVRATSIEEQLKESEIADATDGGSVLVPVHNSAAEFIAGWRTRFKDSTREETVRMAKWMLQAITDARITTTQIKNAFGLSDPQWTTLRDKFLAWEAAQDTIDSAEGE